MVAASKKEVAKHLVHRPTKRACHAASVRKLPMPAQVQKNFISKKLADPHACPQNRADPKRARIASKMSSHFLAAHFPAATKVDRPAQVLMVIAILASQALISRSVDERHRRSTRKRRLRQDNLHDMSFGCTKRSSDYPEHRFAPIQTPRKPPSTQIIRQSPLLDDSPFTNGAPNLRKSAS